MSLPGDDRKDSGSVDDWWVKGFEDEMDQVVIDKSSKAGPAGSSSRYIGSQRQPPTPMHVTTTTNTATTITTVQQSNSVNMVISSSAKTNKKKNTKSSAVAESKSDAQKYQNQSMIKLPPVNLHASLTPRPKLKTKQRKRCGWKGPRVRRRRRLGKADSVGDSLPLGDSVSVRALARMKATREYNEGLAQMSIHLYDNEDVISHTTPSPTPSKKSKRGASQQRQDEYDVCAILFVRESPKSKRLRIDEWVQSTILQKDSSEDMMGKHLPTPAPTSTSTKSRRGLSQNDSVAIEDSVNHSGILRRSRRLRDFKTTTKEVKTMFKISE